jgi:hypothetical protein
MGRMLIMVMRIMVIEFISIQLITEKLIDGRNTQGFIAVNHRRMAW